MYYWAFLIFFLFLPVHAAGQGNSTQEYSIQQQEQERTRQFKYVLEQAKAVRSGTRYSNQSSIRHGHNDSNDITNQHPGKHQNFGSNTFDPNLPATAYDPVGSRNTAAPGSASGDRNFSLAAANQPTQDMLMAMPVEQPLVYDDDGNLIAAPTGIAGQVGTVLQYDGENRLKSVEPQTPVDGSTKIEYVYDYMSRRAAKKVYTYSSGTWSLTSTTTFIYDGWNLIRELRTQNSELQTVSYVWGLDLSGSLQGAGGIGGLLARVNNGSVQQYTYDGNGNVSELVNTDGSIAAHYEYDPYGISLTGAGGNNPFRFSTKYLDAETGLYYYGYRDYSPVLGRWLNRDPKGEAASINLSAFIANNPTNLIDPFGLASNAVYRRFDEWGLNLLFMTHDLYISMGHVYLAFDEAGLTSDEKIQWRNLVASSGRSGEFANKTAQLTTLGDYRETFSYHPYNVKAGDKTYNKAGSLLTFGGYSGYNDKFDLSQFNKKTWFKLWEPETMGLKTNACQQFELYKTAIAARNFIVSKATNTSYGLIANNCGAWTVKMIEDTNARNVVPPIKVPTELRLKANLGIGVGGVGDYIPPVKLVTTSLGAVIYVAVDLPVEAVKTMVKIGSDKVHSSDGNQVNVESD